MINPYHLLGVTIDSSEKEIRQSYYSLALLCHPDRGGNTEEMKTLHRCYSYIIAQIKDRTENPTQAYLDQEKEFEEFCERQKEAPPPFEQIYQENNVFIQEFNRRWNENVQNDTQTQKDESSETLFDTGGYGEYMEASEYSAFESSLSPPSSSGPPSSTQLSSLPEYKSTIGTSTAPDLATGENIPSASSPTQNTHKPFTRQIISYTEPQALPDQYGSYPRFDTKDIKDYGHRTGQITMSDYRDAFCEPEKQSTHESRELPESIEAMIRQREQQLYGIHDNNDKFWKDTSNNTNVLPQNIPNNRGNSPVKTI